MNPPTEQLVRDYLNRLSVAARGKLGFSDRRSLLDRTRTRIEAECGGVNNASAMQVRKVLASLGDPIALVEREQAKMSAGQARQAGTSSETGDLLVAGAHGANGAMPTSVNGAAANDATANGAAMSGAAANGAASTNGATANGAAANGAAANGAAAVNGAAANVVAAVNGAAAANDGGAANGPAPASAGASRPGQAATTAIGSGQVPAPRQGAEQAATPALGPGSNGGSETGNEVSAHAAAAAPDPDAEVVAGLNAGTRTSTETEAPKLVAAPEPRGQNEPDADPAGGQPASSPKASPPKASPPKASSPKASSPKASPPRIAGSAPRRIHGPGRRPARPSLVGGSRSGHTGGGPARPQPGPRSGAGSGPRQGTPGDRYRLAAFTRASAGLVGLLVTEATGIARRNPLEFLAVLVLGIGGAVYPPIWLVGVLLVLVSKKWAINDKLLGVVVPIIVVIVGTVLTLVFGGRHATISAYAFEAWLGAERLSRVAVFLGAVYLFATLRRGRRQPKLPPWNVPHRSG
jgi:hypothetical protein